jgi:hypothetical protein
MKKELIFKLGEKNKLIFLLDIPIKKWLSCDFIKVYFKDNKYLLLRDDHISDTLFILSSVLKKALKNELQVHESIVVDIGLIWNKELHGDLGLIYEKNKEQQQFWVGLRNLLWCTPGNIKPSLATWLYNDKDGNIIFEVTPTYYWNFIDPLPDEQDYIIYEEFIKNYKSLLIEKISKETAEEWILKIDELMKIIQSNEKKFLSEHRSV